MKKQPLKERFQQLAGIKPLYEQDDEDLRLEPEDEGDVVDLADIKTDLKRLSKTIVARNDNLTDAYIRISGRYWNLLTRLEAREARLELVTTQLKNYVPDHWLFESESDEEDNTKEEPEPTLRTDEHQMEFDFGSAFETKH